MKSRISRSTLRFVAYLLIAIPGYIFLGRIFANEIHPPAVRYAAYAVVYALLMVLNFRTISHVAGPSRAKSCRLYTPITCVKNEDMPGYRELLHACVVCRSTMRLECHIWQSPFVTCPQCGTRQPVDVPVPEERSRASLVRRG